MAIKVVMCWGPLGGGPEADLFPVHLWWLLLGGESIEQVTDTSKASEHMLCLLAFMRLLATRWSSYKNKQYHRVIHKEKGVCSPS